MYSSRCFKVKKLPLQQVDIKKQGLKTRKRDVIIYAPLMPEQIRILKIT